MTALTLAPPAGGDTALAPVPWRNMLWVTWRQHRATLISVPAVFAALAVFLVVMGLRVHHDYAALMACHPFGSNRCQALNQSFNRSDWPVGNAMDIVVNFAPALVGAFAGGSLLARELETGTYRYAWTQGIGRTRWTMAQLVVVAVTLTVVAAVFSQLFVWFFGPFVRQENLTALSEVVFDTHVIVFAGRILLGVSIGALAGLVLRRTVPAMAVTLGVYLGVALLAWLFLNRHYGVTTFWPMQLIEGAWLLALSVLLIAATAALVRRRA